MNASACLLTVLLAIAPMAAAETPSTRSAPEIVSEQEMLRGELADPAGPFAGMPSVKREQIARHQGIVLAALEGKTSTEELSEAEAFKVFNSIEAINALVTNREDERIVCKRETRVGTHQVTRNCRSLAQIKADRENSRQNMGQGICNSSQCAPGPSVNSGRSRGVLTGN